MGGIENRYFFYVYKGEIVHSPRRLGGQARLPEWNGDESNGSPLSVEAPKTDDKIGKQKGVTGPILVDVGSMSPAQFDNLRRNLH